MMGKLIKNLIIGWCVALFLLSTAEIYVHIQHGRNGWAPFAGVAFFSLAAVYHEIRE